MTTSELKAHRDAAFSAYLQARKSGKRDRVKLLALIAMTRAWFQSEREDRVIAKAGKKWHRAKGK